MRYMMMPVRDDDQWETLGDGDRDMETKETIGGYGIIDVPDLDSAIAIARTWPAVGHKVEIRPVAAR